MAAPSNETAKARTPAIVSLTRRTPCIGGPFVHEHARIRIDPRCSSTPPNDRATCDAGSRHQVWRLPKVQVSVVRYLLHLRMRRGSYRLMSPSWGFSEPL